VLNVVFDVGSNGYNIFNYLSQQNNGRKSGLDTFMFIVFFPSTQYSGSLKDPILLTEFDMLLEQVS